MAGGDMPIRQRGSDQENGMEERTEAWKFKQLDLYGFCCQYPLTLILPSVSMYSE